MKKRFRRKWKSALGLILFFCLAVTTATAIYVYRYVPDIYRAEYTFFALPAGVNTEDNGGDLTRMLAHDCDELLSTEAFRSAVMQEADSDGKTRLYVRGSGRSHTIRLIGWGFDADVVGNLANAAGDKLTADAQAIFKATEVRTMTEAPVPAETVKYWRPVCVAAAFLGSFLVLSLLGTLFGTTARRLRYGKTTEDIPLPCLAGMARLDKAAGQQRKSLKKEGKHVPLYDLIDENNLSRLQALSARIKAVQRRRGSSITVTGLEKDTDSAAVTALLASELAVEGYGVLAIELDSYQPGLRQFFGKKGTADVLDCIASEEALNEALMATEIPGLYFMDACHEPGFVSRMAGTEAFAAFLADAQQTFQYVLISAPSCARRNDAALLGRLTDLVLLVADDGKHDGGEIEAEARSLGRSVRQVAGYVLCDVPRRRIRGREFVPQNLQA